MMNGKRIIISILVFIIFVILCIGYYFFFYKEKVTGKEQQSSLIEEGLQYAEENGLEPKLISVDKISNIHELSLEIGDYIDIYLVHEQLDEELSKTPWITNIYVMGLYDKDGNFIEKSQGNLSNISILIPPEVSQNLRVVTSYLPNYFIVLKPGSGDLKVNEEINKIIESQYEMVPGDIAISDYVIGPGGTGYYTNTNIES